MNDRGMAGVEWSTEVAQAEWIRERLAPFDRAVAASQVPAGFAAYARVLHPARRAISDDGMRWSTVRWAEVAAHTGLPLRAGTHFQEIALLPPDSSVPLLPDLLPPMDSLPADDARALVQLLGEHTGSPGSCWFCLWEGYAWSGEDAPVLEAGRRGPRVELPDREYLLYCGGIDQALAFARTEQQIPNLWWPQDRSWCVATDLYGWWTYVGGPEELIAQILGSDRLEAHRTVPEETQRLRLPAWLESAIDNATARVLAGGEGRVQISRGTVTATLRLPSGGSRGELRTRHTGVDGTHGSSWSPVGTADLAVLQHRVRSAIRFEFIENVV